MLTERALHEARVFITPGFIFGENGRRYVRLSLCADENRLAEALSRLQSVLIKADSRFIFIFAIQSSLDMELELSPLSLPGIEAARPTVIAGPCSAETEEQVLTTARQLLKNGIKIFRAGIWKPRTKPGGSKVWAKRDYLGSPA